MFLKVMANNLHLEPCQSLANN